MAIVFSGIGSNIPTKRVPNSAFLDHAFFDEKNQRISDENEVIIRKFKSITGIEERRYAEENQVASTLAIIASKNALEDAKIDAEALDGIIVAQNFGDVSYGQVQSDSVPSLASRVKHGLQIKNPACAAYDLVFGCPGWIQSVIVAEQFLAAGSAKRYLVVGAETLSRVVDPHDRDSMIYADGAGACVLERNDLPDTIGILASLAHTYAYEEVDFLGFGISNKEEFTPDLRYIKMSGRKIYEFALQKVPLAMKACMEKAKVEIGDLKKILIHQANEKMDEAIVQRFYQLYGIETVPEGIMPMSINLLGNSSVATVPTLFDLILKDELADHKIDSGDLILLASVGAGMNVNAIVYKMP